MSQFAFRRLAGSAALVTATLAAALVPAAVQAGAGPTFSDLVIFGDSLSDTGNLSLASGGYYPTAGTGQPYYGGGYSNGKLWTEYLATGLGQAGDAAPYLVGGNNFAWAGARTGTGGTPAGLLDQTTLWAATRVADPNALYVLVGGGNDMRDARTAAPGNSALEQSFRKISAEAAVANLKGSLGVLAAAGAKNVLVSNLPDLAFTPEAMLTGVTAASGDASLQFNQLMPSLLSYGASVGLSMTFLDLNGAFSVFRADPGAFGITNINSACAGFAFSAGASCDTSLFSDVLHPSARAQQLMADAAFSALGVSPVPEPQTVALMLAGLVTVVSISRRRARAAA
jgi:outer membrane lipase/esterase